MNWKYFFVALTSVLALEAVCAEADPLQNMTREALEKFSDEFTIAAVTNNPNENVIVSPLLLEQQLVLLYASAVEGTESVLKNALRLERFSDKNAALHNLEVYFNNTYSLLGNGSRSASGIYAVKNFLFFFKEAFEAQASRLNISTNLVPFNGESLDQMNYDILEKVSFRSGPVIPASVLNITQQFLLASAVVFKEPWKVGFPIKNFKEIEFACGANRTNHSQKVVGMSVKVVLPFASLEELDAKAVEVPYAGENLRMLIILPNKKDGLADLELKLKENNLRSITKLLEPKKVHLVLPMFKAETNVDLVNTLTYLGFGHIFSAQTKFSDGLSFIVEDTPTPITNVEQMVVMNVDFVGESSSTSWGSKFINAFKFSKDVVVDHPFFFAIRTDDAILLSGHITEVHN